MINPLFQDYGESLEFLKRSGPFLKTVGEDADFVLNAKDAVLAKFGVLFREKSHLLTEEQLGDFLDFHENHHWTGLQRQKKNIYGNLPAVRKAIFVLANRKEPDDVEQRFDFACSTVKGFGEGIISPILFIMYPELYAVWNSKSEHALRRLGLWILENRGESKGQRYAAVNRVIYYAAKNLNIDLWTIDHHWHALKLLDDEDRLEGLVRDFKGRNF